MFSMFHSLALARRRSSPLSRDIFRRVATQEESSRCVLEILKLAFSASCTIEVAVAGAAPKNISPKVCLIPTRTHLKLSFLHPALRWCLDSPGTWNGRSDRRC